MGRVGAELADTRVLVVDDEPDTLEVMALVLDTHGARTLTAGSAAEGLALLTTQRPDVLLSDIAMPGEDGYGLIRKVRALPAAMGGQTPAAAISAHTHEQDRERAYEAGFQAFLAKPIHPRLLIDCVLRLVRRVTADIERRRAERRRQAQAMAGPERRTFQRRQAVTC